MTTVAAHTTPTAVATKSISSSVRSLSSPSSSSSSSVTMMAMTAGSRTLIEIGNNVNNDNMINTQKEFEIDVSYLDDDYDNGLLILRRVDVANNTIDTAIDIDIDNPQNRSVLYKFSATFKKMKMKRNPLVTSSTCILLGNVASMIGIIPIGLSGFVPALSMMATVGIIKSKKQK